LLVVQRTQSRHDAGSVLTAVGIGAMTECAAAFKLEPSGRRILSEENRTSQQRV
jgi:hypothetical protein